MPGGGTAHGPVPRSFEQKINKKLYVKALKSVLVDKYHSNALFVVKDFSFNGKTKDVNNFLKGQKLDSSLIVCSSPDNLTIRACRNLPNAKAVPVSGLSVYDMVKFTHLIIDEESMNALMKRVG